MEKLLRVLSDGEFHSGEELGRLLGISRAAIWKQVHKIESLGLSIESQKGCGYRIKGGLNLLTEKSLLNQLSNRSLQLLVDLQIHSSVTSTNELARNFAEKKDSTGLVVLAERQTNGRGRRGRHWVSPYGCNLYMSLVWGFDGGVKALEGLSLAVAVAVKQAIGRCGIDELKVKWPNDLLWEKRKVGGILLEVIGDPSGFCQGVIGVGLNLRMPNAYSGDIEQPWANLDELYGQEINRNALAGNVLDELLTLLSDYHEKGFGCYREEWMRSDAYAGERVTLLLMNQRVEGIARGVDTTGALLLEMDSGVESFSGGEISLRGVE
jgi:BirA family biotin operon repressor/biotin-[acetyl-CoA-carboxylase] ligase